MHYNNKLDRLISKINVGNSCRLVVTIPEDLELSPEEVSVLSVGDRYHFNDPNQAFINNGYDMDEFTKFKKTKFRWTPKTSTDAVNAFIEEINLVNFKNKKRSSNLK